MKRAFLAVLALLAGVSSAFAHETRPASLTLSETSPGRYSVVWKVPAVGDQVLHLVVVWPESARDVIEPTRQFAGDAMIERRAIDCGPAGLVGKTVAIDGLQSTMTDVFVRVEFLDGRIQTALLKPARASFEVRGREPVLEIAKSYLVLGVEHILGGVDHLLFVLGLILTVRGFGPLVKADTAFTLAHSATLVLSTLGLVRIPRPPVEVIIALSILFLAAEILRRREGKKPLASRQPWIIASLFGLMHGFGFAGALSEVGFPETDLPAALVMFNVGVEVGQLLFIVAVFAAGKGLERLLRRPPSWWRPATAYAMGTTAAFWMIERLATWR